VLEDERGQQLAEGTGTYKRAAPLAEVPSGAVHVVEIDGQSLLLCNTKDHIYAVVNECSHAQEKLECGRMRAGWIACPVHGARFDLETGKPMNPPATRPIKTFPTRIVDDWIEVEV
jgi:3-phenylpropionate/trans-cinnamate dioxygenase ferredoxin subunit